MSRRTDSSRTAVLHVRLRPYEKEDICRRAANLDLVISDYVRRKMFGADAQIVRRKLVMPGAPGDFVRQISAIGNNLNQLTRRAHTGDIDADALNETIAEISRLLKGVGK